MSKVNWGEIGYITYKRTYARKNKDGTTEEFSDTVERELKGIKKQLKLNLTDEEIDFYRKMRYEMKGSVAGRFMWQLGTKTVDKLGLLSLQNCAFTVVDHPVKPFTWAMDALMLGSGVGYSIKKEHVYQLPKVKRKKVNIIRQDDASADFIVPDTREGWVKLLGKTLKAHFYSGESFTYSTQLIRGEGAPIKGFGGVASGAEILVKGIDLISGILNDNKGKRLRPIHCLDIMNIIGMIVVAGNVRRSAQIAIGDYDDLEFLKAKRWDLGSIPNWRAMSNNSVYCEDTSLLPEEFWQTYEQGEPYGLINIELAKKVGRLGETQYPDELAEGFNPCQPDFATVIIKGKGLSTFGELEIGDEIWSKEGWTKVVNKWSTGVKPVYETKTTGGVFVGTLNHRVDTPDGKQEAGIAKKILTIAGQPAEACDFIPEVVMDGLVLGDGYIKGRGNNNEYPLLIVGNEDKDYYNSEVSHLFKSKFEDKGGREDWWVETSITTDEKTVLYKQSIPQRFMNSDIKTRLSLLRGLYSANGSVIKQSGNGTRITYKTTSKDMVTDIQTLLSSVGIRSYFTTNKSKKVEFYNGEYECKESYDVNISKDVSLFQELVGFIQNYKNDKIVVNRKNNTNSFTTVKERNYLGEYEVFDITVDNDSHTYWTGGLSVSNCAEQSLADKETCCLAEVYLPNIESKEELWKVVKTLYKVCKHSLMLPCHLKETEEIVHHNMRMGIGVTGVMMCSEEQLSWLDDIYKKLRQFDEEYSKEVGCNTSVKLTTLKPSGTLSLLAGVLSGVHPSPAGDYFIRRIRMSASSPLVEVCRRNGYHTEYAKNFDGTNDTSTMVVEFPCSYPEGTPSGEDTDVLEQLEMVKKMQTIWSDNSVSVTAYYKKEDIPKIKSYLKENFKDNFKTLSFLLYTGHGFVQAPFEPILKEKYLELKSKVTPIVNCDADFSSMDELQDCEGGACPIK